MRRSVPRHTPSSTHTYLIFLWSMFHGAGVTSEEPHSRALGSQFAEHCIFYAMIIRKGTHLQLRRLNPYFAVATAKSESIIAIICIYCHRTYARHASDHPFDITKCHNYTEQVQMRDAFLRHDRDAALLYQAYLILDL